MNGISELFEHYLRVRLGSASHHVLVDWAIARLQADEEGNEVRVALLAWPESEQAARSLTEEILNRRAPALFDAEVLAGKSIVELRKRYMRGESSIIQLASHLDRNFVRFDTPDWSVMLRRNCEYAIDYDFFLRPFEREFEYLAGLWFACDSLDEFRARYNREVSNSHDGLTPDV